MIFSDQVKKIDTGLAVRRACLRQISPVFRYIITHGQEYRFRLPPG
jgi:hypothetical protein